VLALIPIKSLESKVGTILIKAARLPISSANNSIAVSGYSWPVLLHLEGEPVRCVQSRGPRRKTVPAAFWPEDGKEVYFERSKASSIGVDDFRVGHLVEFELQCGFERPCAVNIKRVHRDAGQHP